MKASKNLYRIKFLLKNITILAATLAAFSCATIHKPTEKNNIEIVKDILEKKEITETDKKIIGKIIDSKIKEDKEEKKYIKELEKENQRDEKKIESLSKKSGQIDLLNKIFLIGTLCGIGLLLWKFAPTLMELIRKIPL